MSYQMVDTTTIEQVRPEQAAQPLRSRSLEFTTDAQTRTRDHKRQGATTQFATPRFSTERAIRALKPKHRRKKLLAFFCPAGPGVSKLGTESGDEQPPHPQDPEEETGRRSSSGSTSAFTPTSCSLPDFFEVWLGNTNREVIHRGVFTPTKDLNASIQQHSPAHTTANTLHPDQNLRRDPQEGEPPTNLRHTTLDASAPVLAMVILDSRVPLPEGAQTQSWRFSWSSRRSDLKPFAEDGHGLHRLSFRRPS